MTSNSRMTSNPSNLTFKSLWIDGMDQSNLMMTVRIFAWSKDAAAWQDCTLTTDWLKNVGDIFYDHSYDFGTVHSICIDDRFLTKPLEIILHEADSRGHVCTEIHFCLSDSLIKNVPCTLIIRSEIGQLETFGKRIKNLARKPVGTASCLNSYFSMVPDYRSVVSSEDEEGAGDEATGPCE